MTDALYILKNRVMPWGDYGDILLSGMTAFPARDAQGRLLIQRTGPFVPPLVLLPLNEIVITQTLRAALEASGLSGVTLRPVVKARIVDLPWHTWDWGAAQPAEYPDSGEPEDYILARPHDQVMADQMEPLWEVCLEEHARTDRVHVGPGRWDEDIWLVRASWDGTDWFKAAGVGHVYVSEQARRWLEHMVAELVVLETARVR
jgi:hypothetical protein